MGSFPCPLQQDHGGTDAAPSRAGWICGFQKGIQNAATAQLTESPLSDGTGCQQLLPAQGWAPHLCRTTWTLETDAESSMIPHCHSGAGALSTEGLTCDDACSLLGITGANALSKIIIPILWASGDSDELSTVRGAGCCAGQPRSWAVLGIALSQCDTGVRGVRTARGSCCF